MPAWMTSLLRELVPVPKLGAASTTTTSRPAIASARAAASPTTPAPTTTASTASRGAPGPDVPEARPRPATPHGLAAPAMRRTRSMPRWPLPASSELCFVTKWRAWWRPWRAARAGSGSLLSTPRGLENGTGARHTRLRCARA